MGATRGGQAHQEPRKASQRRRQVLEGHLRAKEALMGPPASLPYQERSGHHLAYRTKKPQHKRQTRSRGRQTKKWIDNVKEDLTAQGMNMREAVDNSRNRRIWRSLVEASSSANA